MFYFLVFVMCVGFDACSFTTMMLIFLLHYASTEGFYAKE